MKKVLLGIVIAIIIFAGGCALIVGGMAKSASDSVDQMVDDKKSKDELYNEMLKKVDWKVDKGDFSTNIIGVFENTSEEEIGYIQFNYKTFDANGVALESSFTNEVNIKPGEKRQVTIMLINKDFSKYEIEAVSSAL